MRFCEKHRLHLDPANIPPLYHALIPLAERWGINYVEELDEFEIHNRLYDEASPAEIQEFRDTLRPYMTVGQGPDLYAWLAGPEAQSKSPSPEYLAFTFMGMAYDHNHSDAK